MPGDVSRNHPMAELDDDERADIDTHMKARFAIADCVGSVEGEPDEADYSLADDILLALHNAGIELRTAP